MITGKDVTFQECHVNSIVFRVGSDITFRPSRDQPSVEKRCEIVIKVAVLAVIGSVKDGTVERPIPNRPFEADVICVCGMSGGSAYID